MSSSRKTAANPIAPTSKPHPAVSIWQRKLDLLLVEEAKAVAVAQIRLRELVSAADHGEDVEIVDEEGRRYRLSPIRPRPPVTGIPRAGTAAGLIEMADDFDEPLEELREYMP